jgi:hypothetical protein
LSVWCGACKFEMIMRLYNWYIQQPIQNIKVIEEPIAQTETKKRGRKPKTNG